MQDERKATQEERISFYMEHNALLEQCQPRIGKEFGHEGRQLVDAARQRFNYSQATGSRDIMSILLRGWRKWRSRV